MEKNPKIMVVGRNQEIEKAIAEINKGEEFEVVSVGDKNIEVATEELKNLEGLQDEAMKKYQEKRGEISLPEVGTEFSISGQIFKVTYVNEGKKRLSVEPVV